MMAVDFHSSVRSFKMRTPSSPRPLSRSVIAVFSGFAAGIVLTVVTEMLLQQFGILPLPDEPATDRVLLLSVGYRTLYALVAGYLTASLAQYRPVAHALGCGVCGFVFCLADAIETWSPGPTFRPHWYAVVLLILVLPLAWLAGWLRWRQIEHN